MRLPCGIKFLLPDFRNVINVRDKKYLKAFGNHLRKIRNKKQISQEELNFNAGVGKNQIGNIERGEINPTLSTLRAIAKALNISLKELLAIQE